MSVRAADRREIGPDFYGTANGAWNNSIVRYSRNSDPSKSVYAYRKIEIWLLLSGDKYHELGRQTGRGRQSATGVLLKPSIKNRYSCQSRRNRQAIAGEHPSQCCTNQEMNEEHYSKTIKSLQNPLKVHQSIILDLHHPKRNSRNRDFVCVSFKFLGCTTLPGLLAGFPGQQPDVNRIAFQVSMFAKK